MTKRSKLTQPSLHRNRGIEESRMLTEMSFGSGVILRRGTLTPAYLCILQRIKRPHQIVRRLETAVRLRPVSSTRLFFLVDPALARDQNPPHVVYT